MSDSKDQLNSLELMIGTLINCSNLSTENYDTLITKTTQYSAKLLKKTDQGHMVAVCGHLFWRMEPNVNNIYYILNT